MIRHHKNNKRGHHMPTELNLKYHNLADYLEDSMQKYADKPAYSCLGQTMSFAEIDEKSKALACFLQQKTQLKAGDRIAIQLPNLIQYPVAVYAALRAELIIVNTNPLYTPTEMAHQFSDSGAKAIIILSDLAPKLKEIQAKTEIDLVITTSASDFLKPQNSAPENAISLTEAIAIGTELNLNQRANNKVTDTCIIQYTGGTTGISKGACLSHQNIIANAEQSKERLASGCREAKEIFACPLPVYHIYAFTVNMILFFKLGNLNILIPNPRDLDAFISDLTPFKITGMSGLNTLFVGLCMQERFKQLDFSQLRLTISGGTALTKAAADIWKSTTGCTISEGYGLSETSPVLCLNKPKEEVLGTVGKPVIGTDLQIWDSNNQITEGEGEIVAKGPQVMSGYWQKEDETAKAIINGYFKTGDIGIKTAEGHIRVVDRLKDLIIVSGFNVYPNEVENILTQHTSVIEAAVIGEADEKTGEKVIAYVVTQDNPSVEQLIEHCRTHLTAYKIPKNIILTDELPKSTVGKILRRKLRE